jgi:hypothetical protein
MHMAKIHHAELKDLQNERSSKYANRVFSTLKFKRKDGSDMTGVDITYLACFRSRGVRS